LEQNSGVSSIPVTPNRDRPRPADSLHWDRH
jgi:hypothetical protein